MPVTDRFAPMLAMTAQRRRLTFLMLLVSSAVACGQQADHPWWVSMGAGPAVHGGVLGMSAGMDYCYQLEHSIISGRIIGATNENPTIRRVSPSQTTYKLADYGILYGPLWTPGNWRLAVSTGLGVIRSTTDQGGPEETRSGISLPLEAQAFYRFTSFAGAGAYAYASMNGVHPLGGFLLVVQLGSFGPAE